MRRSPRQDPCRARVGRRAGAPAPVRLRGLVGLLISGFLLAVVGSYLVTTEFLPQPVARAAVAQPPPAPVPPEPAEEVEPPDPGAQAVSSSRARSKRRTRRSPTPTPAGARRYGSLAAPPPGWVQSGPDATTAPRRPDRALRSEFLASSCVAALACPDGRPIAVDTGEKRDDVRRGLLDQRIVAVLLDLAVRHDLAVMSFQSSHSAYVQDGSGRRVYSNHALGRAADIRAVDGQACVGETTGAGYRGGSDGLSNPAPADGGPCLALAREINQLSAPVRPTETIFYFDVGAPSGVSLENHDDHVHVGFNSFDL